MPEWQWRIYLCEDGPVGESYNKRTVYNLINVGAYSGHDDSLEYAYKKGWFTLEKCIEESGEFLQEYVDRGQNTLYALDWDYQSFGNGDQVNQYSTLVNDAENKSIIMYKRKDNKEDSKEDNRGILDYELTFSIPIYENIPSYDEEEFTAFPDPNKLAVKGKSYY